MSVTFQLAAFFLPSVHFKFAPSFHFSSRLNSQVSISCFIISLQLFSYLLLITGGSIFMVAALKPLAAVMASLTIGMANDFG